ncbi:MAG: serine/threonine protein kinase [Kiritimatiellae bacterium]|nr:serine/threonine protein kinase [Kiritimatiellia bacterium]
MTFEPGETIGAYRVVRLLRTGGMGAVYEVEHMELGVRYALKVFVRDHGDVESLRMRFSTEGKALARLRHPNLVRVYDLGEDEGRGMLYFIMDLVVGRDGSARTLADVQPGEADEAQLARWYAQLKSALEYIHAAGIVHRDLKPGNVLLDADGNAVLGDFGISRFLDEKLRRELDVESTMEIQNTDPRKVMGSVMFLAPEVRRGENATAASDAYALGVTFYRLLTGVWYEPGPVADGLLAEFGREWSSALGALLSDDPARRLPIPSVGTARDSWKKRWRVAVALGLVFVVLAVVALVLSKSLVAPKALVVPKAKRGDSAGVPAVAPRGDAPAVSYAFDEFFPVHASPSLK